MEDALGGNVVERLAIAGSASAIRLRYVIRRRLGRRIGQGKRAQQVAAGSGAQIMRWTPDFLRPVDRFAILVEQRAHLHDHRRGLGLVDEFLFPPPAHTDGFSRLLHSDDRSIRGGIIGAIVTVAARSLARDEQ